MSDFTEFATPQIVGQGNNLSVVHGDDRGLIVQFIQEAVKDEEESRKAGRPIYRDVDMVSIKFPGDKTRSVYRRVKTQDTPTQPSDITRWPRQWAAYKASQVQAIEGTPLEQYPPLTKGEVLNLKSMNIFTVEQLASVPDSAMSWMGARAQRDAAVKWLEAAKDGAVVNALAAENQEMKAQIEALTNQISGLADEIEGDDTDEVVVAKPKRGRKKKA